jgi:membrane-associated phospholipid phosphatase
MTALAAADRRLLRLARTVGHSPRAERRVARFSQIGEHAAVWLAIGTAAAVAAPQEERPAWWRAVGSVAGAYALNTALKLVVRRPRPHLAGLPQLTGTPTQLSFPSAHATTSFAAARLYAQRGLPATPLRALAWALAASRVYLGVHYPSDVLGGALLGDGIARAAGARIEADRRA